MSDFARPSFGDFHITNSVFPTTVSLDDPSESANAKSPKRSVNGIGRRISQTGTWIAQKRVLLTVFEDYSQNMDLGTLARQGPSDSGKGKTAPIDIRR